MKVHDLTSAEQAEWALEHDDELVKDLVERLSRVSETMSPSFDSDDFRWDALETSIQEIPIDDILDTIDDVPELWRTERISEIIHRELKDDMRLIVEGLRHPNRAFRFWGRIVDRRRWHTDIPLETVDSYQFEIDDISGIEHVPNDVIVSILERIYGPDLSFYTGGDGWVDVTEVRHGHLWLSIDEDVLREHIVDKVIDAVNEMGEEDPSAMVLAMYQSVGADMARRMKKLKLPPDVEIAYAQAFFADPENGDEVIAALVGEYDNAEDDVVLMEISARDLVDAGIEGDFWYSGAPWRLVSLNEKQLPYEGALQRHCIGRPDMPYTDRLRAGSIYAWSLRSKHRKPVITFEVDRYAWDDADDPEQAAAAIVQMKGKLNRDPPKDEDEMKVLEIIADTMGFNLQMVGLAPRFVR